MIVSTDVVVDDPEPAHDSRLSSGVAIESYPDDIESLEERRVRRPGVCDETAENALEEVLQRAMSGAVGICIDTDLGARAACCCVAKVADTTGAVRIAGRADRIVRSEIAMGAMGARTMEETEDGIGFEADCRRVDCQNGSI